MSTPDVNPYQAPSASVDETASPQMSGFDRRPLASRSSRLAAAILDSLAVFVPAGAMGVGAEMTEASGGGGLTFIGLGAIGLLGVLALNVYWLYDNGQSIGKRIMDIKILRSDQNSRASLTRILLARGLPQAIVGFIPLIGRILQLVDVLFIFGEERRCIHDYIADTSVVDAPMGVEPDPADQLEAPAPQRHATSTADDTASEVQW